MITMVNLDIILKNENIFIGDCGITLQNINGKDVFEIGYHINKKYQLGICITDTM